MSRFSVIRDFINNLGVGKEVTYQALIQTTSMVNGIYSPNVNTVYTYCRILRALGYLVKKDRNTLIINKPIPKDKSYNLLRLEYQYELSNNYRE